MSARAPQSGGRPWVAVHTWMLNDPDVLLAGNAARALWMSLLLWSAQAGTAGAVVDYPIANFGVNFGCMILIQASDGNYVQVTVSGIPGT